MKLNKLFLLTLIAPIIAGCGGGAQTITIKLYYDEDKYFTHEADIGNTQYFKVENKIGYQFNGYFDDSHNQYSDELGKSINPWKENDPKILYGDYEAKIYTIDFILDGGTMDTTTTYKVTYDTDISYLNIPAPRKTSYKFVGFYTKATGGNQITDSNTNFVSDAKILNANYYTIRDSDDTVKFYARYEEKLVNVYLTGLNRTEQYHIEDKVYAFDYELKDGYCFAGYYYDSEFNKKIEYPLVVPDTDVTIALYPLYLKGTEKGLSYTNDTDNSYIATYSGSEESIIVPDAYMGTRVNKIGVFTAPNASFVAIPQTVTTLSEGSFMGLASLENIVLSRNITIIPKNAFSGCESLKEIGLSTNATMIGDNAFYECISINKIVIPSKLETLSKTGLLKMSSLQEIVVEEGNKAFYAKDGILYRTGSSSDTLIKYPEAKEGYSFDVVEKINKVSDYAFSYCSLRRIYMDNLVTTIGEGAFYASSCLTYAKVDGPNRLSLGKSAFAECPILSTLILNVQAVVSIPGDNVFENSYKDMRIFVPNSVYSSYLTNTLWRNFVVNLVRMTMIFGDYCIDNYEDGVKIVAYFGSETNLVIPEYINGKSVLAIGENAFIFNEYLEVLELNEELKLIKNHAFKDCFNLERVYINGDFIKSIDGQPFEIGVNFFLRNNSSELLEEYKASWEIYQDYIWTAN